MSILKERQKTHGEYAQLASIAQRLKTVLRTGISSNKLDRVQQESLDLICTKLARIVCGNPDEPDHWVDISGYADLVVFNLKDKNTATGKPNIMEPPDGFSTFDASKHFPDPYFSVDTEWSR